SNFVDRHDVGVIQVSRGFRFGLEATHVVGRRELAAENHLEGDESIEADLARLVNDAHSAACDLFLQLVIAEVADCAKRRDGGGVAQPNRWDFGGQRRAVRWRGTKLPSGLSETALVGEEGFQLRG